MAITGIYANVACSDLARSRDWYETLFGRAPDAEPMDGLVEWHWDPHGFQLHNDPAKAGNGTLTLMTSGLHAEKARLAGLGAGEVEPAAHFSILRLRDPDGNLVVLAGDA